MRAFYLLSLATLVAWLQAVLCTAIPYRGLQVWGETLDGKDKQLVTRDGTNKMLLWINSADTNRASYYQYPTYRSKKEDSSITLDTAGLQTMAEDGYNSVLTERATLQNRTPTTERPKDDRERGDMTAVLYVPGMGVFSSSLPKGGGASTILARMATVAPNLQRSRGTTGSQLHVEDGVIYYFESLNPGWLAARGNRFPNGTRLAVFGKYRFDSKDEARDLPSCADCQRTFSGLNIAGVPQRPV